MNKSCFYQADKHLILTAILSLMLLSAVCTDIPNGLVLYMNVSLVEICNIKTDVGTFELKTLKHTACFSLSGLKMDIRSLLLLVCGEKFSQSLWDF